MVLTAENEEARPRRDDRKKAVLLSPTPRIIGADFSLADTFQVLFVPKRLSAYRDAEERQKYSASLRIPYGDKTLPQIYQQRAAQKCVIVDNGEAVSWPMATIRRTAHELVHAFLSNRALTRLNKPDALRITAHDASPEGFEGFSLTLGALPSLSQPGGVFNEENKPIVISKLYISTLELRVPWKRYPSLYGGDGWEQRMMNIRNGGTSVHWPELDVEFSLSMLLAHARERAGC